MAPAAGSAPAPDGFKDRCAAFTPRRKILVWARGPARSTGSGPRAESRGTCMISLPRGVADSLAPHPDLEIEPARRHVHPGPVLFSVLADPQTAAVVGPCDQHEADNRDPRDHEGNSAHGVVLSVFRALLRRASAVRRASPRTELARKWSSASGSHRAMPACRAGDVTGCLADESWLGMKVPPLRLRFQKPPRSCYANPQWLQRKDSHLHRHELTARRPTR